ncbi:hypothetical protein SUVZ_16G2590 [Saccharomyces uvarum]|uniref:GATA-type domain-containing protein n=1 Tax=Saccharomyces uvarum TaxID=230603 RepID=A0ABN8WRG5_SACUV|nr:hypothetical protein SUVZ_16G2590 [Saccharomyces uvarum]
MLYNKVQKANSIGGPNRRTKYHFDRFVQMVLFIAASPEYCSPVNSIQEIADRPSLKRADALEQKIKSLNNALGSKLKEADPLGEPAHNSSILAPSSRGKDLSAAQRPKSRKKQTILPNGQLKECATCGDTWTSQWRSGPDGNVELCSRCGIAYRKKIEKKIRQQQCGENGPNNFIFSSG